PEKRERYDRGGPDVSGAGGFGGFDDVRVSFGEGGFDDLFESFFGRRGGAGFARRGADQEAVLELSLEEAATGGRRSVTLADGRTYHVGIPARVRDGPR